MSTTQLTGAGRPGFQEVGTLQASHVYILWHSSANLLKIGKANSVLDRAKAFGLDSIDLGRSVALRLKSVAQAVHVEKTLHRTFKKWSVSKDDAIAAGIANDGATEWFSTECRERLFTYLETNSDLFDFALVSSDALRDLLEARESRRLELDRLRVERELQDRHRRLAADVRKQSIDARLADRTVELERQFEGLASLFEQRLIAVERSPDAVFIGCNSPWEGRFELLFLSRPSFTSEGRDFVWVDLLEASVSADGYHSNLITSSQIHRDEFCNLEQINISIPRDRLRSDGQDWTQFSKFVALLRSRPMDSVFLELTASDICEAADYFFDAKCCAREVEDDFSLSSICYQQP